MRMTKFYLLIKHTLVVLGIYLFLNINALAQTVLCLGDSLTEGYGVKSEDAWPDVLQKNLKNKKPHIKVINAGVAGDTTASAVSRLKWQLRQSDKRKIDLMILEYGANDGLRGLAVDASRKNLEAVIDLAQSKNIKIVLAGMLAPPNMGKEYTKQFEEMFKALAKKHSLPFIPFFLKGVVADKKLNLPDGIHPNEKGHQVIAKTVQDTLEPLL